MSLVVRDARADELDDLVEIMLAGYAEHEPHFPPERWAGYTADIAAARDRLGESELIVAEHISEDGTPLRVGVVTYFPAYRHSALAMEVAAVPAPGFRLLAVTPDGRGLGAGRVLVEECIRRARAQGATALVLHTATFMTAAVRLYERLGFVRVSATGDDPNRQLLEYRLTL
jgi:GNAT superfamily N-acetyltransferase